MGMQFRTAATWGRLLASSTLIGTLFLVGCGSGKKTYTICGTVSNLQGSNLALQDNGADNLSVTGTGSVPFTFAMSVADGGAYAVTIVTQPTNQICTVTGGSGTVQAANVTTVAVTCTNYAAVADGADRVLLYQLPLSNGQAAAVVLGQANFTASTPSTTATGVAFPVAVAADKVGNLYVGESNNCRVTQFKPPFTNGMAASLALGQPNLTTGNCPTAAQVSATSLGQVFTVPVVPPTVPPTTTNINVGVFGTFVDHAGNLWVTDAGSNRVLEYTPPFSTNMAASVVIGQPNFTSSVTSPVTGASLNFPNFAGFDRSGNLWVPDFGNNRVLEFVPPFTNGKTASVVLGQPDLITNSAVGTAQNLFNGPGGVTFDSSGNLWISDFLNNRVLEFVPPFTNNMNASLVLGQPDFVSNGANTTAATMNGPNAVGIDPTGKLLVTDSGNSRTLVFAPPFTTGMSATAVIGQPNFTTSAPAVSATGQTNPWGTTTDPPPY